jgi:WD40 repeat protein
VSTLLQYGLASNPDILQASSNATLTLTVSNNNSQPVTCTSIAVTFNVGTNPKDLTSSPSTIATQPFANWNVGVEGGIFTLTPATLDAGLISNDGLSFVFANVAVNDQPGITTVRIDEVASSPARASGAAYTTFPLAKFPPQFTLGELNVQPAEVSYGGSALLSWQGSPATYTIAYDPDGTGLQTFPVGDVGPYSTLSLTNPVGVDFTLTASITVPGSDEPLTVPRYAHVGISNPPPTVASFHAVLNDRFTANETALLSWTTTGRGVQCQISGDASFLTPSGSLSVPAPPGTPSTTFTLTASNATGQAQASLEVGWAAPPTARYVTLPTIASAVAVASGTTAYVACANVIVTIDLASGKVSGEHAIANPIRQLAISPDGARLYAVDAVPTLTILDTSTFATLGTMTSWGAPTSLQPTQPIACALSADGATLFVPIADSQSGGQSFLARVDVRTNQPATTKTLTTGALANVALSPDGTLGAFGGIGPLIMLFDPARATVIAAVSLNNPPGLFTVQSVVFSSDGKTIFALCSTLLPLPDQVHVLVSVDVAHRLEVSAVVVSTGFPFPGSADVPTGLAVTPDGAYVLCAALGNIAVFATSSLGAPLSTMPSSPGLSSRAIALAPDGSAAVVLANFPPLTVATVIALPHVIGGTA